MKVLRLLWCFLLCIIGSDKMENNAQTFDGNFNSDIRADIVLENQSTGTKVYSARELRSLCKTNSALNRLPISTCLRIRQLKLNKRKRGKKKQKDKIKCKPKGVNPNNLRMVPLQTTKNYEDKKRMKGGFLNCRSIKNKDLIIRNIMIEDHMDFCVIAETWLGPNDDLWVQSSELNTEGFKLDHVNRKTEKVVDWHLLQRNIPSISCQEPKNDYYLNLLFGS